MSNTLPCAVFCNTQVPLADNIQGPNEAVHVFTIRHEQVFWPKQRCLLLGNSVVTDSFPLLQFHVHYSETCL